MSVEAMSDAELNTLRDITALYIGVKLSRAQGVALIARIDAAERERDELRAAATALRDDMLERAKMDAWQNDGDIIVEAGAGVWSRFNAVLDMPSPPTR